jgi:hypothetical protein
VPAGERLPALRAGPSHRASTLPLSLLSSPSDQSAPGHLSFGSGYTLRGHGWRRSLPPGPRVARSSACSAPAAEASDTRRDAPPVTMQGLARAARGSIHCAVWRAVSTRFETAFQLTRLLLPGPLRRGETARAGSNWGPLGPPVEFTRLRFDIEGPISGSRPIHPVPTTVSARGEDIILSVRGA